MCVACMAPDPREYQAESVGSTFLITLRRRMENQRRKFKVHNKKLKSDPIWRSEQLAATKLILKEAYKKTALVNDPAWPDILRELPMSVCQEILVHLWFVVDLQVSFDCTRHGLPD